MKYPRRSPMGLAAWTKNEGNALFLAMTAALLISVWQAGGRRFAVRAIVSWMLGVLPPLLALSHFKYAVAPANEIVQSLSGDSLAAHIFDPGRHLCLWRVFLERIFDHGHIAPLFAVAIAGEALRQRRQAKSSPLVRLGALLLALIASVYYLVYLLTPYSLAWHANTSLARLLAQLWPTATLWLYLRAFSFMTAPSEGHATWPAGKIHLARNAVANGDG